MNLGFKRRKRPPPFTSPLPESTRTVVFEALFDESASLLYIDPLAPSAANDIREFRPAALAGRFQTILIFANKAHPTHALIIFTGEGERCLSDRYRDALWAAYGLPVFEQVITPSGKLVAWECEAHDGLHLAEGAEPPPGSRVDTGVCGCGVAGRKVIDAYVAPALATSPAADPTLLLPAQIKSATRPLPT